MRIHVEMEVATSRIDGTRVLSITLCVQIPVFFQCSFFLA